MDGKNKEKIILYTNNHPNFHYYAVNEKFIIHLLRKNIVSNYGKIV